MAEGTDCIQNQQNLYETEAARLIKTCTTLVLATMSAEQPWCAPVYYVYQAPGFYFFSSPNAKHIQHIGQREQCAGAIFADADRWEDIQGLQMRGIVRKVSAKKEHAKAVAHYLIKYPFAAKLLSLDQSKLVVANRATSVHLYRFKPVEVYYSNNRLGFGKRFRIAAVEAKQEGADQ